VIFVPGLTEGAFPLPGRQDPILLDEEREALSFGDHALPLKSHRPREERLLFMLALEAARERLILSLPRAVVASGAEKIPSYFLLQSLECLAGWQLSHADLYSADAALDRVLHVGGSRLLERDHRSAIDRREFDLGTVGACLASPNGVPNTPGFGVLGLNPAGARYLEALSPNFARAVKAEQAQWGAAELTVYDGALDTPECRPALAELFSPQRVYSATTLERYATCPYRFFLTDVLRLRELEDPVAIDELGARDKGDLMHAILREFYEEMKAERKLPLVGRHLAAYRDALAAVCERHFQRVEREGLAGFPNAWAFRRRFILQDLERHLQSEINRNEKGVTSWIPEAFEEEFGGLQSPAVEIAAVSEDVRLRGQIDRLDLSSDRTAARVVDYKSGKKRFTQTVGLQGGAALQLPLYLMAAAQLRPGLDLEQSSAEYCHITRRGGWSTCTFPGSSLVNRQPELRQILQTIVDGCRQGLFSQSPDRETCAYCEYARVGDPRRDALARRKQDDPRLRAFRQMREIP
jgi:RecB family exonuclease